MFLGAFSHYSTRAQTQLRIYDLWSVKLLTRCTSQSSILQRTHTRPRMTIRTAVPAAVPAPVPAAIRAAVPAAVPAAIPAYMRACGRACETLRLKPGICITHSTAPL